MPGGPGTGEVPGEDDEGPEGAEEEGVDGCVCVRARADMDAGAQLNSRRVSSSTSDSTGNVKRMSALPEKGRVDGRGC